MGGDGDCALAGSTELGTWIVHASVARYAFDLGDWDSSGWIVPHGSSGHPDSPHVADQAQDWAAASLHLAYQPPTEGPWLSLPAVGARCACAASRPKSGL